MKPEDYIGKMYQVNFSGRCKEFCIVTNIVDHKEYPGHMMVTVLWQNSLRYDSFPMIGFLRRINMGEWIEV